MTNFTSHSALPIIYIRKINMGDYNPKETLYTDASIEISVVEPTKEDMVGEEYIRLIVRKPLLDRQMQEQWSADIEAFDTHIDKIRDNLQGIKARQSDNLVKIYEYGLEEHTYQVIVYECGRGFLLSQELEQHKRSTITKAVRRACIIARTLQDLHNEGIYLNVGPNNILIRKKRDLYLLCFRNIVQPGRSEAHPFLAPENFDDKAPVQPGPASDQYALATMLCQMVSGEVPFPEKNAWSVGPQHINDVPTLSRRIPLRLRTVLLRALAKKPEDRFKDMEEFAKALEEAVCHQFLLTLKQLMARRQAPPWRPVPRISRRKLLAWATASVIALVATGGVLEVIQKHITSSQTPAAAPFTLAYTYKHASAVNVVTQSPDSNMCASCDSTGIIKIYDKRTHSIIQTYTEHYGHAVTGLVWYPLSGNDYYLASISEDGRLHIWNSQNETVVKKQFAGRNFKLAWTSNAEHLLIGVDNEVQSWDNPVLYKFERPDGTYKGHSDIVNQIATTHGNPHLVATGSADGTAQLWDAETPCNKNGSPRPTFIFKAHTQGVSSINISSDANFIASAGEEDKQVLIWDANEGLDQGNIRSKFDGHKGEALNTVAWHPNSKLLAAGGTNNMVYIFDLEGTYVFQFPLTDIVETVSWSPDGQHLAASGVGCEVQIWRATQST